MQKYEELLEIIKQQQETIQRLENEIAELKERLNKNSHNSSKPPSTDGYEKPSPKSQRKKSGKKAGGQDGHKGHNMVLEHPDRIEKVYPAHCMNCANRENCAHLRVNHSCYAVDIIVKKETVKYQMMECCCNGVHQIAVQPAGINGTVTYGNRLKALICVLNTKGMVAIQNLCEIVEGLTGLRPSEGTVVNMLRSAAKAAKVYTDTFPQKLNKIPVVHCDETGVNVNGKLQWVHVIGTSKMTYYALSEKRGSKAMLDIDFLPGYKGIVVHDFWMSYFKVTEAEHAMCGAHLLRELTGIFENHPEQTWARDLYDELMSMCRAADYYNQHPDINSRQFYMDCLKQEYDKILAQAVEQNPIPENKSHKRGKPKRGKIRALIDRLIEYKGEVCRFADDPLVPFSNNQAERDLRMVKLKNKVIGCFRSTDGAKDFLTLKSFTSSAMKSGLSAFSALLALFQGNCAWLTE